MPWHVGTYTHTYTLNIKRKEKQIWWGSAIALPVMIRAPYSMLAPKKMQQNSTR